MSIVKLKLNAMLFPPISPNPVRRRYLAGVMQLVGRAIEVRHLQANVTCIPADQFVGISHNARIIDFALTAMFKRDDATLLRFSRAFMDCIQDKESAYRAESALSMVALSLGDALPAALETTQEILTASSANESALAGLNTLRVVLPSGHHLAEQSALVVLGLNGVRGGINAFSDERLPGFLAFSINNPAAVVAEEILHESVHTWLWSYIQMLDVASATFLKNIPGVYSPFTRGPRSAIRVIHGILSYGAVLALWERLTSFSQAASWLESPNHEKAAAQIKRRQAVLSTRLHDGWLAIRNVLDEGTLRQLAEATQLTWALEPVLALHPCVTKFSQRNPSLSLLAGVLPPIETAEALLAINGEKVSRLTLPLKHLHFLEVLSRDGAPYCLSNEAVVPRNEPTIGGYSNSVAAISDIDTITEDAHFYLYLADTVEKVRCAAKLDRANLAGELFGIPECCRAFFACHWDIVREAGADLFAYLLKTYANWKIEANRETNAAAMYFGAGLCWHFPCSLTCNATKSLIKRRVERLSSLAPQLATDLMALHRGVLLWSSKSGYAHIDNYGAECDIPMQLRWLNGLPFYLGGAISIGLEAWACSPEENEIRRVVILK